MARDLTGRAQQWADARETRVAGRNPWSVGVATVRATIEDRVTGLAAEMAFFALLSLVPIVVAIGASLGWLELLIGSEAVGRVQAAVLTGLGTAFSPQVTSDVLQPLVEGLLDETRGGLALSGIVIAVWLASRVFTATIRALDLAYNVEDRRGVVVQRLLAVAFALSSVVVVSVTLAFVVVGPLLGTARDIAERLGFGEAFAVAWGIGRWPVMVLIVVGFFATVYRFGPNVRNTWRDCLPGAVLGVALWLLSSVGFRIYLATAGSPVGRFEAGDEGAALLGVIGGVLAAMLWIYLSSIALLVGGELNALLAARGARRREALDAG